MENVDSARLGKKERMPLAFIPVEFEGHIRGFQYFATGLEITDKHAVRVEPYRGSNERPDFKARIISGLSKKNVATIIAADNIRYWYENGSERCDGIDINLLQINAMTRKIAAKEPIREKFERNEYRVFLGNVLTMSNKSLEYLLGNKDLFYMSNILDGCSSDQEIGTTISRLLRFMKRGSNIVCSIVKSDMFDRASVLLQQEGVSVKRNIDFGLPKSSETVHKPYHIDDFAVIQRIH